MSRAFSKIQLIIMVFKVYKCFKGDKPNNLYCLNVKNQIVSFRLLRQQDADAQKFAIIFLRIPVVPSVRNVILPEFQNKHLSGAVYG